jgi:hypothetical protein
VGYSPDSNDVSTEAEESPVLKDPLPGTTSESRLRRLIRAVVNCRVCELAIVL